MGGPAWSDSLPCKDRSVILWVFVSSFGFPLFFVPQCAERKSRGMTKKEEAKKERMGLPDSENKRLPIP